ncbi:MAG: hypothetical protein JRD68_09470 [Deltaproteobacteria bacterium]|nr:hypothetical protein [Deltaproteobacteria bacterium]
MPTDPDELSLKILAALLKAERDNSAGDTSMWIVGEELGLGRNQTQDLVMDLAAEGLVEIKSLSGTVLLTEEGRNKAGEPGPVSDSMSSLDELAEFIDSVEVSLDSFGFDKQIRQDLEVDISTLKGQVTRSKRLPAVLEATLEAVKEALGRVPGAAANDIIRSLDRLIAPEK